MTQEPMVSVAAIKDLLSPDMLNRASNPPLGFVSLNVEINFASKPPYRVWSRVQPIYRDSELEEFQVLALILLPNRIEMAMAEPGSQITLLEIGLDGKRRFYSFRGSQWTLLAASIPAAPNRLAARIKYDEQRKGLEVELTDSMGETEQHTLFEQKGDEWEFVRVKQWQKTIPAINPATPR